jgi:hypothetical protein
LDWIFDPGHDGYVLEDAGTHLARIYLKETAAPKNRFRVRTLVSFLYFSPPRQKRLESSRKEWASTLRKFPTRDLALRYIDAKKGELVRFIRSREG